MSDMLATLKPGEGSARDRPVYALRTLPPRRTLRVVRAADRLGAAGAEIGAVEVEQSHTLRDVLQRVKEVLGVEASALWRREPGLNLAIPLPPGQHGKPAMQFFVKGEQQYAVVEVRSGGRT